jgi:hypothetical protein
LIRQLEKMKPNLRLTSWLLLLRTMTSFWRGNNVNGQRRMVRTMDENEELSMKI